MTQQALINKFQNDINRFNAQRVLWLVFSAITIISLFLLGAGWNDLHSLESDLFIWVASASTATITAVWWVWTMLMIRRFIDYQYQFISVLTEITDDLSTIRHDLKEFNDSSVDK